MSVTLHKNDLPDTLKFDTVIAVDTETMGLQHDRDPLCLVQLSSGDGTAHIVQLDRESYDCPNLKALLGDPGITTIFHYARFDLAIIKKYLNVDCTPTYCTRTASKLVRTYTDKHGLRHICKELLGIDLNKQQQSSYWGAEDLSEQQLQYAANDVLHLHNLKNHLDVMLERENRKELAQKCFEFLPVRADLDLEGWNNIDIFEH